jgi:hypothetical protein
VLDECDELARISSENRSSAAAYPPGSCAAQKVLLLLGEDGALAGTITERWYSSKESETQSPIAFALVHDDGVREDKTERFNHGATVPPCGTCVALLPLLLCPGDKVECSHAT